MGNPNTRLGFDSSLEWNHLDSRRISSRLAFAACTPSTRITCTHASIAVATGMQRMSTSCLQYRTSDIDPAIADQSHQTQTRRQQPWQVLWRHRGARHGDRRQASHSPRCSHGALLSWRMQQCGTAGRPRHPQNPGCVLIDASKRKMTHYRRDYMQQDQAMRRTF